MTDATSAMIERIREEIFERAHRGEGDPNQQIVSLRKHATIAHELANYFLEGRIHTTIAVILQFSGQIAKAIEQYEYAYSIFEAHDLKTGMAIICNNQGELLRTLGRYDEASTYYQKGLNLIVQPDDKSLQDIRIFLTSNLGSVSLDKGDHSSARRYYKQCLDIIGDERNAYPRVMSYVWRGFAEIELAYQNYERGWSYIKLAHDLAQAMRDKLSLIRVYLTQAHLAEADPTHQTPASHYYAQRDTVLAGNILPIWYVRAQLEEARYQAAQGNQAEAESLRQSARTRLEILGVDLSLFSEF